MPTKKTRSKNLDELDMDIPQSPADELAEGVVKLTKRIEKLEAKQAPMLDDLSDAMLKEKRSHFEEEAMKDIRLFVSGTPKGQPRPRAFARNGMVRMYDPGTAEGWKAQVAEAFRNELPEAPILEPVAVKLFFRMPRPKKHFRTGKHSHELRPDAPTLYAKTPDADNLAKAVLDALTILGLWKDDAQVVELHIEKRWVDLGQPSGCLVFIGSAQNKGTWL